MPAHIKEETLEFDPIEKIMGFMIGAVVLAKDNLLLIPIWICVGAYYFIRSK